jgi:hypothetical protein
MGQHGRNRRDAKVNTPGYGTGKPPSQIAYLASASSGYKWRPLYFPPQGMSTVIVRGGFIPT